MADVETLAVAALLTAAVVALAVGLWLAADADGSDGLESTEAGTDVPGGTDLRSCTTIDSPGRYVLTTDITDSEANTCFLVRSSDVVLDGAGHTVDGVGAFGTAGVVVRPDGDRPLSNVTVRDLTTTDWDDGLRVIGVEGGRVVGTTTADNRVGLQLLDARRITVADTVARGNRLRGIELVEASANNTLRNTTATGNAVFGIQLVGPDVRDNTLLGNTATDNEFGVVLIGAHDNTVSETTADANHIAGIWLSAATANVVSNNTVSNQFYGVFLSDQASRNTVTANRAESNRVGIRLRSAHGNAVTDNSIRASRDTGILLIASDDNRVVGNTGVGNARGIVRLRSTGNVVRNNSVG